MALPETTNDLSAIPEVAHDHYAKQDDGTYRLTLGDVTGLQSALKSERENARKFEADWKASKAALEAVGATPEEIAKLKEDAQKLNDLGVKDAEGLEAVVAGRVAKYQKEIADRDAAIENMKGQQAQRDAEHTAALVRTLATQAAIAANVDPTAVPTAADMIAKIFNHVSPDGRQASIRDSDGYAKKAEDQVTDLTIEKYIAETLKKECPFLWPPSAGGGAKGGERGPGGGNFSDIKDPVARLNALRAAGRTQ